MGKRKGVACYGGANPAWPAGRTNNAPEYYAAESRVASTAGDGSKL